MASLVGSAVSWVGGTAPGSLGRHAESGGMAAGDGGGIGGGGGGGAGVGGAGGIGAASEGAIVAAAAPAAAADTPLSAATASVPGGAAGSGGGGKRAAQVIGAAVKSGPEVPVPVRRVRTTPKAPVARALATLGSTSDGGVISDDEVVEVTSPFGAGSGGLGGGGGSAGGNVNKKRRAADALPGSGGDDDDDDDDDTPRFVGKGKGAAPGNRTRHAKSPAAAASGPPYSGRAGGGVGFSNGLSSRGGMSGKSGGGVVRGRVSGTGESGARQRRLQPPTGRSRLALPSAASRSLGCGARAASASPSARRGEGGGAAGPSGVSGKPERRRNVGRTAGVVEIDLTGGTEVRMYVYFVHGLVGCAPILKLMLRTKYVYTKNALL